MKKTKFAVLFTALTAMLGLSSCLGEPDPYSTMDGIFRTDGFPGYYKFKTAYGLSITPTNPSMITGDLGDFAYIYYKYDNRTVTEGAKNIDAELQAPPAPIKTVSFGKTEGNAPFVSYQNNKEIMLTRYLYDKNSLFLNMSYNVKINKNDQSKNDFNAHSFHIWREEADEKSTSDELVLRLSHVCDNVEVEGGETMIYNDIRRIDLSSFLYPVEETPRTIKIIYQVKDANSSSEDKNEIKLVDVSEPFTLNYEEFCSYFPETPKQ